MVLKKGACSDKPVTNFPLHDVQYNGQLSKTFMEFVKFWSRFCPLYTENPPIPFSGRFRPGLTIILQFPISFLKKGRYSYIEEGLPCIIHTRAMLMAPGGAIICFMIDKSISKMKKNHR
jgi:hypothetical protein